MGNIFESTDTSKDYKLYEIRPEIYYNLQRNDDKKLTHLLSAELFYIYHTDKIESGYYYDINNKEIEIKFDEANYQRIKYGLNCKYNFLINLGKRISLMQAIGFGIKHRHVGYSNVKNARASFAYYIEDGFFSKNKYRDLEGRSTRLNFEYDIKLVVKL